MSLSLNGIQAVAMGGKDCLPNKLNTEMNLRLQNLSFKTETDTQNANEVLADCFPKDREYVLDFLTNKATLLEKEMLRNYLIGGDRAVQAIDSNMNNLVSKLGIIQLKEKPNA